MATQTQEQKLAASAGTLKKALDEVERLKKEAASVKADLSVAMGQRDYYRNRTRVLAPLAQLVLGEERLQDNNLDLQSLVAAYFRTAVTTTPESAMKPVLEAILEQLSPAEEAASCVPDGAVEASAEKLLT